jgi:DNA-binding SARP family transcriptional activator
MERLRIELFGGVRLHWGERPFTGGFRTQKSKELFAFLVLGRGRSYSRSGLATVFWGDHPEPEARRNLRHNLSDIRKLLLHNGIEPDSYFTVGSNEIGFSPSADFWLDVAEFQTHCDSAESDAHSPLGQNGKESLERALELYRGELLESVYEDWCQHEREALRDRFLNALACLMQYHQMRREWDAAIAHGKRLLRHDVLLEHIHRDLMHCYYRAGNRPFALKQFLECARCLSEELNVGPMEETTTLYQHILNEDTKGIARIHGGVLGSPASGLQGPSDQVDRTISNLNVAREQLDDASTKIDKAIQDVLGLSDESGVSTVEFALLFAFAAAAVVVAGVIWPV